MKKKLIVVIAIALSSTALFAQVEKAIGVRFGTGGEISYQQSLSSSNRVELDLGLASQSIGLTGIYHWVNDLSDWTEGMAWYYGPGATIGFSNVSTMYPVSKFALGVSGQIGLEYKFEFPLQISLDYRPTFFLMSSAGSIGSYNNAFLSARYRF